MAINVSSVACAFVEPTSLGRCHQHRVLAADVVRERRVTERLLNRPDDVEVGDRRLDHDGVGPLVDISSHLAE